MKSLIEQWFPCAMVGAESLRERGAVTALPPTNFLHVWWARRPLTTSRAAILASALPAWPSDVEAATDEHCKSILDSLQKLFPLGESQYHKWFLSAVGILGDSVKNRAALKVANANGVRLSGNGYGYDRAFSINPSAEVKETIATLIALRDGNPPQPLTVLDVFAGGGSIPFESLRYGFNTISNELNPVAGAILEGTVVLPFRYGRSLSRDIEKYGMTWAKRVSDRLSRFFPKENTETVIGYVWAHTVPCPTTGFATPLAPNYWLANNSSRKASIEIITHEDSGLCTTRIHEGARAEEYGNRSTYKNGTGISVWTNEPFDGNYIQQKAQQGEVGQLLLAVVYTSARAGRKFRAPNTLDLQAITDAEAAVASKAAQWDQDDLTPSEPIPVGHKTAEPRRMGMRQWRDMFSPRQLLSNVVILEELQRVSNEAVSELGHDKGRAVALYLAYSFDRCLNYNSRLCAWHPTRIAVANTFDRHDFSFKWSFAEFEAARELVPWSLKKTLLSYNGLVKLAYQGDTLLTSESAGTSTVVVGSATDLSIPSNSIDAIVTDPPYYDNVMYAECSDFFYVWLKRALRYTWPEFCTLTLTDKEREAVANAALFKDVATHRGSGKRKMGGKTAAEMADARYEMLLTDAFREANRVLKDDGIMTIMFTHKRVDAWDTLGMSLLESGFCIESSWPVHTESENSLHQAKKNSASSTILLTCRKRQSGEPAFWTDIRGEIEHVVAEAVSRFSNLGIVGVDLTLATYGPALSVLSRNWPVYTGDTDADGTPLVIRPDMALDLAREKVAAIKKRGLLGGRQVDFDRQTDWWLLAWSDFQAREFPSPEALKLSIATHLDLEDLVRQERLLSTTSGTASILTPQQRRAAKAISTNSSSFTTYIDALHTLMLVYDEDGLTSARAWLSRTGYGDDQRFRELIRAALNAVPRMKAKGNFALPEASTLDAMRANLFEDIPMPIDQPEQLTLASV